MPEMIVQCKYIERSSGERRPCAGRVLPKQHRRGYISCACASGHTWVWCPLCCDCPRRSDADNLLNMSHLGCCNPLHWFERDSFDTGSRNHMQRHGGVLALANALKANKQFNSEPVGHVLSGSSHFPANSCSSTASSSSSRATQSESSISFKRRRTDASFSSTAAMWHAAARVQGSFQTSLDDPACCGFPRNEKRKSDSSEMRLSGRYGWKGKGSDVEGDISELVHKSSNNESSLSDDDGHSLKACKQLFLQSGPSGPAAATEYGSDRADSPPAGLGDLVVAERADIEANEEVKVCIPPQAAVLKKADDEEDDLARELDSVGFAAVALVALRRDATVCV